VGLTEENLVSGNLQRIAYVKEQIGSGKLGTDLRWTAS
jgi:hypothetical protein